MPEGSRHKDLLEHEVESALNATGAAEDASVRGAGGISRMYFFFGDLKVVKYTQKQSMSFGVMLAGVAGYLGLFLGISVVTIIEVLEFIFVWAFNLHGGRTGRGRRRTNHGDSDGDGDDTARETNDTEV